MEQSDLVFQKLKAKEKEHYDLEDEYLYAYTQTENPPSIVANSYKTVLHLGNCVVPFEERHPFC